MALSSLRQAGSEAWKSDTTYRRVPRRFDRFNSGICPAYGLRESAGAARTSAGWLIGWEFLVQQRHLDPGGPVLYRHDDVDDHGDRVQGDGQGDPRVVEVGQDPALARLEGRADRIGDRLDAREPVGKHGKDKPDQSERPQRAAPWRIADQVRPR